MSVIDFLNTTESHQESPAVIFKTEVYTYSRLCQQKAIYFEELQKEGVGQGSIVTLVADYSPEALALLLALMRLSTIIFPITNTYYAKKSEGLDMIKPNFIIELDPENKQIGRAHV